MVQINRSTEFARPIRCKQGGPPQPSPTSSPSVVWECYVESKWIEYSANDNNTLNRLYSSSPNKPVTTTLSFSNLQYIIDFTQMTQTNQATNVKRQIRVKSTSPSQPPPSASADLAAIRSQVEYYFSDINVQNDPFLHSKLLQAANGWVPLDFILAFPKMRAMKATANDTLVALKPSSAVETKVHARHCKDRA